MKLSKTGFTLSVEWYDAMLSSINDGVIVIDSTGKAIYANGAAAKIFGCSVDKIVGHTLGHLMPTKYRDPHNKSMHEAGDEHSDHVHRVIGKTIQIEAIRADGTEFPIELTLTEKKVGHKFYFIGVIRDITDKEKSQEDLKIKMEELEKMNKFMIGRELKMVELKKEITDISHKLENKP